MQPCSLRDALTGAGLQDVFLNLSKHSIKEADHVVECSIVDIIHLGQTTYSQAEFVLRSAAALLAPRCVPLRLLLQAENSKVRLSLGLPYTDSALGCGLLVGAITELVGSAGIGKSQMCMTLAAKACLPSGLDTAVVYIDTEMKFKQKRLLQIMGVHLKAAASTSGSDSASSHLNTLAKRVHVIQPKSGPHSYTLLSDCQSDAFISTVRSNKAVSQLVYRNAGLELMNVLQHLPEELARRSVGLVVVDSIAMLARLEFSKDDIPRRQRYLAQQAALLKQSAEQFNLTVVVTNQIMGGQGSGSSDGQRAALGVVWSHAVNTRLVMEQRNGVRVVRVLCLANYASHTAVLCWRTVDHAYVPLPVKLHSCRVDGRVEGQLSNRGGLQVAKCPVCGPVVSGYTIGEAGIVPVDQQVQDSRVQSVLEANISAEHHAQEGGQQTQYA